MKLNLRRLTNRSLDYGGKLFIHVTNNNAQEAAKTSPPFLALAKEHKEYSPLVGRERDSEMSDAVKTAAKAVLHDIKNIKRFAVGYEAMYPDTDKGKAATAVLKAIAKGGKLYNRPAGDLDSKITTVVTELSSPQNWSRILPHWSLPHKCKHWWRKKPRTMLLWCNASIRNRHCNKPKAPQTLAPGWRAPCVIICRS